MSDQHRVIGTAAAQWFLRPEDERFTSWAAFEAACRADAETSREKPYNLRDLSVEPAPDGEGLHLVTPRGRAQFNHWSFGQTARLVGAPASYLAGLPAELAARCLNHGLTERAAGTAQSDYFKLYARRPQDGGAVPTLRALTTDTYTRITDASLYPAAYRLLTEYCSRDGHQFHPPTDWTGQPSGLFRGDRDSFMLLVDGGSIVEDPSAPQGSGQMWRGVMIGNSEVGARSITIETVLFRYCCGNLNLWGAAYDARFRRRHVGAIDRRTMAELRDIAWRWSHASAARDTAIVRYMIDHQIAETREGVIKELRALGASETDARAAYERCEATESASPRSYWGIAAGLTRIAQDHPNMDDRLDIDAIAAKVTAKAVKLARV